MADMRNGGGTNECKRTELTRKYTELYSTGGKAAVQEDIRELLGPEHDEGTKAALIERVVTATIILSKRDREDEQEVTLVPINGENNDQIDEFDEVDVTDTCDLRQFVFDALKDIRKQGIATANDVKKIQKVNMQHKFRYVETRGYCTICMA